DWDYNLNNELTSYDDVSYVYDDNGNMIRKSVGGGVAFNFVYNIENRLSEVRNGSDDLIATYYYDPFGRRLWKEVYGVRTYFHYSDEGLIGEYDDGGTEIKIYGWRPDFIWGTDPVFMKVGSEYYFYHNDHLGTPQKMTAINGAVVWIAKYNAFGNASVDGSSAVVNSLRFPGQYFDDETGLHYNWQRYYDLQTGRYLTPDPIGLSGGGNLYIYANPVNFIDPLGLIRWEKAGGSTLGLIGSGLGMFVGGTLVAAPDLTMLSKVAGGVVLAKSTAGWGLNWYNLTQAFKEDCDTYDAPPTAARGIASVMAPGNKDALLAADAIDLSIDLAIGRGMLRYPYGKPNLKGVKGLIRPYNPINITFTISKEIKGFQVFEVGKTVYGDLWQE
ncbi:MAG: RHS domain-containing protein, partial [Desulfobulbaceae bacterium]|nr:RHS domain-containing protein [Desulfobulbaceae bacterium]